jgi:hypothetical protein
LRNKIAEELLLLSGLSLVAFGLSMWSVPLSVCFTGFMMVLYALAITKPTK